MSVCVNPTFPEDEFEQYDFSKVTKKKGAEDESREVKKDSDDRCYSQSLKYFILFSDKTKLSTVY